MCEINNVKFDLLNNKNEREIIINDERLIPKYDIIRLIVIYKYKSESTEKFLDWFLDEAEPQIKQAGRMLCKKLKI